MRSSNQYRAPLKLKIAAGAGLLFLHLPILLIFVYAFTTEERSYRGHRRDSVHGCSRAHYCL